MAPVSDKPCPFCHPNPKDVFHTGTHLIGLWDSYPVAPGHALLVPKRHVATWFDATEEERSGLLAAINVARDEILARHQPDGFNIGINIGEAGRPNRLSPQMLSLTFRIECEALCYVELSISLTPTAPPVEDLGRLGL